MKHHPEAFYAPSHTEILRERDRAKAIAEAIFANCQRENDGLIDHATWDAEQMRLWKLATEADCASLVMRLVAPSLSGVAR